MEVESVDCDPHEVGAELKQIVSNSDLADMSLYSRRDGKAYTDSYQRGIGIDFSNIDLKQSHNCGLSLKLNTELDQLPSE